MEKRASLTATGSLFLHGSREVGDGTSGGVGGRGMIFMDMCLGAGYCAIVRES